MRLLPFFLCLLTFGFSIGSFSQNHKIPEFGKPSEDDFALKVYEKDSTAAAVVLYERGYYYFDAVQNNVKLIKRVYKKIKVFDAKRFEGASVDVPLMFSEEDSEKITGYRAIIHNGNINHRVGKDAVFVTSVPEIGKVFRMVFPNVKNGSIIEYSYKIESPFLFNFYGWEFQGPLPKIYSGFLFKIPLAFQFNNVLYGNQPLDVNISEVIQDCLQIAYNSLIVACPITYYAMLDVPAFQQEDYMLSSKNYISRVEFEPKELHSSMGWKRKRKFATEWKDVDKFLKKGDIGDGLKKIKFFKKLLPSDILSKKDNLEKAKALYSFIQNHYTWDGRYYSSETKVKDAFDSKKGSVPEINLSLINALNAADLDAKLMLLSTRDNGLPTELYPVMTKFNYTVAVLKIDNKTYLLDATNKEAPFGIIPFKALNVQGRVMDFKKGSYWMPIEPYEQNIHYVNSKLTANESGNFIGSVTQANYGYLALAKRNTIEEGHIDKYIKNAQKDKAGVEITDYKVEDINLIEKPLKESYSVELEPETVGDKAILSPFFHKTYLTENPFKMKERSYPMDFGFPFTNTYLVSIDLGNEYEIDHLPKSRSIKLPSDDGECSVTYITENNKINIRFNLKLSAYRFQPAAYQSLKEFFREMITILKDESIILKRK